MQTIIVDIALAAEKYQKLYQGTAKNVLTTSRDGRRVQLPLMAFRPFLTHEGVFGTFVVKFDDTNKLQDIKKIN